MQHLQKHFLIFAVYSLFICPFVFGQESPADKPAQIDAGQSADTNTPEKTTDNTEEEKKVETGQPRPVLQVNPVVQNKVNEQLRWTPEDPSFLYETRFIPDIKIKEEFLPVAMEKEVIKERIEEEKNFRESLKKIQIRLPDMKQSLVLVAIIIIILVYRARAKKQRGK